jgi:hypothetical protein
MALLDPAATWVLLEPTPDHVLAHGLLVDWCDVAVLGASRVERGPAHEIALGLADTIVLWEADLPAMSVDAHPERAIACSLDPDSASLRAHLDRGGRGVVRAADGTVYAATGPQKHALNGLEILSGATEGCLLAAVATVWALTGELDPIIKTRHAASMPGQEQGGTHG